MSKPNPKQEIQIIPTDDLKPHIETADYRCKPSVEYQKKKVLIVHNAYDGRDAFDWMRARKNVEN